MPLPAAALLAAPAVSTGLGFLLRGRAKYDASELRQFVSGLQNDPSFLQRYQRLAASGQPTTDSLLAAMRVANPGLSSGVSSALANQQAQAFQQRGNAQAFGAFQAGQGARDSLIGQLLSQIAGGEAQARQYNAETRNSLLNQGLGAANGLAGMAYGGQVNIPGFQSAARPQMDRGQFDQLAQDIYRNLGYAF